MKITFGSPRRAWPYIVVTLDLLLTPGVIEWRRIADPEDWGRLLICFGNGLMIGIAAGIVLRQVGRRCIADMIDDFHREATARHNERMAIIRTELRKFDEGEEWKR